MVSGTATVSDFKTYDSPNLDPNRQAVSLVKLQNIDIKRQTVSHWETCHPPKLITPLKMTPKELSKCLTVLQTLWLDSPEEPRTH